MKTTRTTTRTTARTATARTVIVRVSPIGINHGYWADIVSRNGRVIREVGCYATRDGAERAGLDLVARI
jgi:hypothetical protein